MDDNMVNHGPEFLSVINGTRLSISYMIYHMFHRNIVVLGGCSNFRQASKSSSLRGT